MIYINKEEELNTFENIYTFSYKDLKTTLTASPDEIEQYKDILPCKELETSLEGFKTTLSNDDFFWKAIN
jgi:hypothetical protein